MESKIKSVNQNTNSNSKDLSLSAFDGLLEYKETEDALYSSALIKANSGEFSKSFYYYEKLLKLNPTHKQALYDLGAIHSFLGNFENSINYGLKLANIDPTYKGILIHIANTYSNLGYHKDAMNFYKRELEQNPINLTAWSDFFLSLNYINLPIDERISLRNKFTEILKISNNHHSYSNTKIKIGYLSSDFRNHAVAYFIKGLITKHDKTKFDIYYYSISPIKDEITDVFIESGEFKDCHNLSVNQIIDVIQQDNIDILIDLNGFTQSNKIEVFLEKPSPIQITWLGFLNSMGIPTIEYKISDDNLIDFEFEDYYSEKIIKLKNSLVYDPPKSYPPLSNLPFEYNNYITFGYFNNLRKLNTEVLDSWINIFNGNENCKLLLIKSKFNHLNNNIITYLNERGFHNIEFKDESNLYDLMKCISLVDIALDAFPHSGGATTAHTLWMGVPVLTIQGNLEFERISSSISRTLGLDSFVCKNVDEYIQRGRNISEENLKDIRFDLRGKFPKYSDTIQDLEKKLITIYNSSKSSLS